MSDSIKNQFNNSVINNPIFINNINEDKGNISENLEVRNKILSLEIKDIYRQLNYHIDENVNNLGSNFFIAEQSILGGIGKLRILIKCLYKNNTNVLKNEIQIFDSEYNMCKALLNVDKGFLITNTDFDATILSNIICVKKDELNKGVFNVIDSLKSYIIEYEKEEIFQRYIDLKGKIKEIDQNIVDYLLKEISIKNALFTIFGDFGTGKSTILNKICYEVSKLYLLDNSIKKPLLIELKDFYNNKDITSLVYNAFRKQYRGIEVLPDMIMKEIKEGTFLLLLDGFDEMSAQISVESRFENFNKLSYLLESKSLCILTCRSSYFITQDEYKNSIPKLSKRGTCQSHFDLIGEKLDNKYIYNGDLNYDNQSQIIFNNFEITINPLEEDQIKTYFEKCSNEFKEKCNSNVDDIYNFILEIYDLRDLITKPILLSIITDTILLEGKNYYKSNIKYGHSALYEKYTQLILKRDWSKGESRHYLTMVQRNRFAEAIAITMLYKGVLEVKYDDILNVIDTHKDILTEFKEDISNSKILEFIASDIRICSFLRITDENTFKFVHKSFMEFFVAQLIVTQLVNKGSINVISEKVLNKEILFFIGGFGVYKADIQKRIFAEWRKNNNTRNQILKQNLCSAFILSKMKHVNIYNNNSNISEVNIESLSIKKIIFEGIEFEKVNFTNVELINDNFINSNLNNIRVENTKINNVKFNNSKFIIIELVKVIIDTCFFKSIKIEVLNCKDLLSKNTEYEFIANNLNILDSEYIACKFKNELTDSIFKRCIFKDCTDINLLGNNNILESVNIISAEKIFFNGHFTIQKCKFTSSNIEINDTIKFLECDFKNCKFIGNGLVNSGQFVNCIFDDCLFVNFYIEYDYLSYKKKDKSDKSEKSENDYLDKEFKIERESLKFNECKGIILTNFLTAYNLNSTLFVFNIENYQKEISIFIKQKEDLIKKWVKQEIERKEKQKGEIEQIKNEILNRNNIKNKAFIDKEIREEINSAITNYRKENAHVITEVFNEKKEKESLLLLKKFVNFI